MYYDHILFIPEIKHVSPKKILQVLGYRERGAQEEDGKCCQGLGGGSGGDIPIPGDRVPLIFTSVLWWAIEWCWLWSWILPFCLTKKDQELQGDRLALKLVTHQWAGGGLQLSQLLGARGGCGHCQNCSIAMTMGERWNLSPDKGKV